MTASSVPLTPADLYAAVQYTEQPLQYLGSAGNVPTQPPPAPFTRVPNRAMRRRAQRR